MHESVYKYTHTMSMQVLACMLDVALRGGTLSKNHLRHMETKRVS